MAPADVLCPGVFLTAHARCRVGIILVCAGLAWIAPARAQDPSRSVLLLNASERNVAGYSTGRLPSGPTVVDLEIERILRPQLGGNLYHYSEHIDPSRLSDPSYVRDVLGMLRSKYEARTIDVIILIGDTVVNFISEHRADFFPAIPVVFSATDPVKAMPNSTGILTPISQRRVLETALRVQPDTRHVVIVAGTTSFDRYYVDAARREFTPYEDRLTFTYLTGLPIRELLSRVTMLPEQSIILYMGVTQDGDGRMFLPQEMLDSISAAANAPTYSWSGVGMDHGLVGGAMFSPQVAAEHLAALALRLIKGESAEKIPVREVDPTATEFDWRQLRRWNISESRLPANSTILFKPPGAWEMYKAYILSGAVLLILQTALIVGLVIQRARRRRTEQALRQSYEQNQDLAGRLIHAQENERARIARDLHDDLSQQLAGVSIMISGLKRKVAKPGAQPEVEQAFSTLQDRMAATATTVRSLSHELHPGVVEHSGLTAALRSHCADIEGHHQVAVTFNPGDGLDSLDSRVALCLFRVVQEATTNVVRHAHARTIGVNCATAADSVALDVVDDGVGFDASESTKSGLGLRSIHERVRVLQGSVSIESRPGGGTKVQVRIPIRPVAS